MGQSFEYPNFLCLTLDGRMGRGDKMPKNDVYIISVGQELSEISQVQNRSLYRLLYGEIARHWTLGDKNSSNCLRVKY